MGGRGDALRVEAWRRPTPAVPAGAWATHAPFSPLLHLRNWGNEIMKHEHATHGPLVHSVQFVRHQSEEAGDGEPPAAPAAGKPGKTKRKKNFSALRKIVRQEKCCLGRGLEVGDQHMGAQPSDIHDTIVRPAPSKRHSGLLPVDLFR